MRLTFFGMFAFLTMIAPSVFACSVTHVQSAAEITDQAELIVLVKVPDVRVEEIAPIKMDVVEVIKGELEAETLEVDGQTSNYAGPNDREVPYDFVRPGGRMGYCFAFDYKPDGYFLLFLKNGKVHWSPLAAINEEVEDAEDPWVLWVKDRLASK